MWRSDEANLQVLLAITKALADEQRVRALCALRGCELCVCQLIALLELAPSTVSKHMSILRQAGLVTARKDGRWVHYRLSAPERRAPAVAQALDWVFATAEHAPQIQADARRLEEILELDVEALCKMLADGTKCCSSAPATPAGAKWPKAGRAT